MKSAQKKSCSLSDVKLLFRPKSITFNKARNCNYRLYLEKNVQVINEIHEIIHVSPRNPTHIFNSEPPLKPFRVTNEKFSTYQLTLYEVWQNGEQTVIDSAEFSLTKFLTVYFKELLAIEEQLRGKEKSTIAEEWRTLSNNFTRKAFSSAAKFKVADAVIEFSCVPETDYDQLVREDEVLRERKKAIDSRNRRHSEFTKSKTLPTEKIEHFVQHKKYHENDSDSLSMARGTEVDEKTKKEVTESLKNFHIRIPEAGKLPETSPSSNSHQIISALSAKSKENNEKSSLCANQIINDPIPKIKEEEQKAGLKGQNAGRTREGKVPEIFIKNFKELSIPETNSLSMKIGNLSLNSVMYSQKQKEKKSQSRSNTRQLLLTAISTAFYLFLIVFLMFPIPKVS